MNKHSPLPSPDAGLRAAKLLAGLVALWARAWWRIVARNPRERLFWACAAAVLNCLVALLNRAAAGQADLAGTMRVARRRTDRTRAPATAGQFRDAGSAGPYCRAPRADSSASTTARVRTAGGQLFASRGVRDTGAVIARVRAPPGIGVHERRRRCYAWAEAQNRVVIVAS